MLQRVEVVVCVAFEPDCGPVPGEAAAWIAGLGLARRIALPAAYRDLWSNTDGSVLLLCTGVGAARAAASVMALGLDPRFDLHEAYWLVAGIAGIDPGRGSLGSVVLVDTVVDGDLAHAIDSREIAPGWPDGRVPLGRIEPYEQPLAQRFNGDDGIVYRLDSGLLEHALAAAAGTLLEDTDAMRSRRLQFAPAATAHLPPGLLRGAEFASTTFWHGRLLGESAARWVEYQTAGEAVYTITAMEDAGILRALAQLARAGRTAWQRVLVVRGASNHDRQREGISAADSLAETRIASYSAYRPALENVWRVGSRILAAWLAREAREHLLERRWR